LRVRMVISKMHEAPRLISRIDFAIWVRVVAIAIAIQQIENASWVRKLWNP